MKKNKFVSLCCSNKIELALLLLAAVLLFYNLGDRAFGGDETYTMQPVQSILATGIPQFRSNISLNYTQEIGISTPVPEYLTAISLRIFGFSEYAARLPFALAGFFAVIAIYLFVRRVSASRKIALLAMCLTVFSAMFYIHARQARYYSITLLLVTVFFYAFYEYFIAKKNGKWGYVFTAVMILLFYSHVETAIYTSAAVVVWFLVKHRDVGLKRFFMPVIPTVIATVPLFFLLATTKTYSLLGSAPVIFRQSFLGIFVYYFGTAIFYLFIFFIPVIFLLFLPRIVKKYNTSFLLFLMLFIASHLLLSSLVGFAGAPTMRKIFVAMFPIVVLFNAEVIYFIWARKGQLMKAIAIAAICLLIFTNFLLIFPAVFFKDNFNSLSLTTLPDSTRDRFIGRSLQPRFYFADYMYGITHHYESPLEKTIMLLRNGSAGDTVLYPTNWDMMDPYINAMDMKISYKLDDVKQHNFTWIIWEDYKGSLENMGVDLTKYKEIHYSVPSYINDSNIDMPDLVHYRFWSDGAPEMNITVYERAD
jgi:4-amino-4-deoxy-L-arabinose transferase-like glycosyltransferase